MEKVEIGRRVIFTEDVDRYPHFVVKEGYRGTIVSYKKDYEIEEDKASGLIEVKLDNKLSGAETWDNCVHFYGEGDYPLHKEFFDSVRYLTDEELDAEPSSMQRQYTSSGRRFLCVWGDGYKSGENAIIEEHGENFFCDNIGYEGEMVQSIKNLCVGESYIVPDVTSMHSVVRIK